MDDFSFNRNILKFIIGDLTGLCDVNYVIALDWHIVSDVLDLKVVSIHFLNRNSLLLLYIVDVFLFIRNHLDSTLRSRRVWRVHMDPLTTSSTHMACCRPVLPLNFKICPLNSLPLRLKMPRLNILSVNVLLLLWVKMGCHSVALELSNLHLDRNVYSSS